MILAKPLNLALALMCAGLLAGCDRGKQTPTQALVRVNDSEITVHQVENALRVAKARNPTPETRKRLLEQMVDREVAVQEAMRLKLDQRPEVMLRLEELKRDVLASTWGEMITAQVNSPGEDELLRYHDAHPELFSGRRIYRLQELTWPLIDSRVAEIWRRDKDRPGNAVVAALNAAQIPAREQASQRAAENLPIEVAAKLRLSTGMDYVLFETPNALLAFRAISFQPAPIGYEAARPRIQTYLSNNRGKEAVAAAVGALRKSARIDYLGAGGAAPAAHPLPR